MVTYITIADATSTTVVSTTTGIGVADFIALTDTPSSYTADYYVKVNSAGDALEFVASSGGGATQLSELSDVNTSTPTNRNVLIADGVDFESRALTEADVSDLGTYQVELAEGQFIDGDKTKLDGIETGADVTDTTNVTAAGALMDSEVTNLAAVKAFDPTDYATAAQGATADTALQPGDNATELDGTAHRLLYIDASGNVTELGYGASGTFLQSQGAASIPTWSVPAGSGDVSKVGTPADNQVGVWTGDGTIEGTTGLTYDGTALGITGNITVSGTVDGRDVATDGSKLDGIEAGADVTDTANVTAAGALMDSEVTNLAQVKAFDSADYATAAQGATADSAMQDLIDDTTPQLGGNLDGGANDISVNAGQKFILDGSGGNTYLTYNSSTSKLELYVDGVKKMQWG